MSEREAMEFDVVIVGAGPAGLTAAIRLKQRAPDLSVCVVEKGSEVGAHILSGAVIETRALQELLPDWKPGEAPFDTPAREDRFLYLTRKRAFRLPTPPQMHNHGNCIVSLGDVVRWLGAQAEGLGVEIYPGFAASDFIEENGRINGVITGDMGVTRTGEHGPNYQPGIELRATYTLFAEGCRGSLAKRLVARFGLREGVDPQTYAIGVKELWEVPEGQAQPGLIIHSVGWPLKSNTYGGSFLYHLSGNRIAYGFVVGLDYPNPWLNPFEEMQRLKLHPGFRPFFEGGKRISYGARAMNEGGLQSLPTLVMPGGALIGCDAGFLNVPKIKGTHLAMKSGLVAADAVADALAGDRPDVLAGYPAALKQSWLWEELHRARNVRPGFAKFGFWGGMANAGLDTYILRGRAPWTLHHAHADNTTLQDAANAPKPDYLKPDGKITFDRLSSVFISNTNHAEDQPVHLKLRDPSVAVAVNWERYRGPESRYCPAGVYEFVGVEEGKPRLQINAQNCVHCKTCDIKDPTQNIDWVTPEGGGGPNYPGGM